MLPKKEKPSKITSQQLDLISLPDKAKHQQKNRRLVTVILIITFTLSLGLWVYRGLKKYFLSPPLFSFPQINLPSFSQSSTVPGSFNLASLPASWQVVIKLDSTGAAPQIWRFPVSTDTTDFTPLVDQLALTPALSDQSLLTDLPQGVEIHQIIDNNSAVTNYSYLIKTPNQKTLFVWFKTPLANDPISNTSSVSALLTTIYWDLIPH